MGPNPLSRLQEHGQAFWLDNLTRAKLRDGELEARVREEGLTGVTSNPAIVRKALASDDFYRVQIGSLAREGRSVREIYEAILVDDARAACDVLRAVYDDTRGRDGFVSLEVSPYLAYDPEGTLAEARHFVTAVDRPNLMIKIPGTEAALPAIEQALREGINVNITLLFSVERYDKVARAYVAGLRRRLRGRMPVDRVASVASFFLSRIDVLADRMLAHRIRSTPDEVERRPQDLFGRTAVENARHAYRTFERVFRGATWQRLADAGARPQRLLWASTGNKNPLYDDLRYVEPLIAPHTVNTMPDATAAEFRRRGRVARTLHAGQDGSPELEERLREVGVELSAITDRLEVEAVQKFLDPLDQLMEEIATLRRHGRTDVEEATGSLLYVDGLLRAATEQRLGPRLLSDRPGRDVPPEGPPAGLRLVAPDVLLQRLAELRDFADELRDEFHDIVLVATGTAAALARLALGVFEAPPAGPYVRLLDPTAPTDELPIPTPETRRVFVVIGEALDRSEHLDRILLHLQPERTESPEFAVVAEEGSTLARSVVERGFRRVLTSPAEVGAGAPLSYEVLVPMALLGADVESVLRRAIDMRRSCGPEVPVRANPALRLGCVLGALAARGRDRIMVTSDPELEPLAAWIRWLRPLGAASPVDVGAPTEPESPDPHAAARVHLHLALEEEPSIREDPLLAPLVSAGGPVVRVRSGTGSGIGGELMRWDIATAAARFVLHVGREDRTLGVRAPAAPRPERRRKRWRRRQPTAAPSAGRADDPGGASGREPDRRTAPPDSEA